VKTRLIIAAIVLAALSASTAMAHHPHGGVGIVNATQYNVQTDAAINVTTDAGSQVQVDH
jgi:hypothetical protein